MRGLSPVDGLRLGSAVGGLASRGSAGGDWECLKKPLFMAVFPTGLEDEAG